MTFKVGDKVKFTKGNQPCLGTDPDRIYTVGCVHSDCFYLNWPVGELCYPHQTAWQQFTDEKALTLSGVIKVEDATSSQQKYMTLKERFLLLLTPEPKKSFRKAEITDDDSLLTEEGKQVFLSWLLHSKFAEEFNKDIVTGILIEKEKEKI